MIILVQAKDKANIKKPVDYDDDGEPLYDHRLEIEVLLYLKRYS